ncbi:MAG: putative DNA-binding domain-containing protein [Nannocystaceae bacterium]
MSSEDPRSPGPPGGIDDPRLFDAFVAAIREVDAAARIQSDLAGFYRDHGIDGDALVAMVERGPSRLLMYRKMVRGRLHRTIREFMPRTFARLGKRRFDADFAAFMAEAGSHTVLLREVPREFLTFTAPRWRADGLADYLVDLARHEIVGVAVRNDPGGGEAPTGLDLALDRPLRFDGSVRFQRYAHAVHRLTDDPEDRSEPTAEPVGMLVYRDREGGRARYIELTPRASEVIDRLLAGAPVEAALREGTAAAGQPLDDDFLSSMVHLFTDLVERQVILGAIPDA